MESTSEHACPVHGRGTRDESLPARCPVGDAPECELFRSVFTVNTLLMRVTDKLTGSLGLTGSRWLLLSAVVWGDEAPTITELSQRCLLSVQNVSRMIASMESEGLVERSPVPGGGRAHRVVLTERGREVLKGTVSLAEHLREGFLAGLSDDEVGMLSDRMERLVTNLRRMEEELSA